MDMQSLVKNLHPLEIKVLRHFKIDEPLSAKKLQEQLQYKEGHANQVFSWLTLKELVQERARKTAVVYELTELGKDYAENGFPLERIIALLKAAGPLTLPDIAQRLKLQNKEVGSSFGELSKAGCAALNDEKKAVYIKDPNDTSFILKKALVQRAAAAAEYRLPEHTLSSDEVPCIAAIAKKRGAADSPFKIIERDEITYTFTEKAALVQKALDEAGITGEETGQLTAESLKTGAWKTQTFRSYNIQLPPARLIPGRTNPYGDFLEGVKDKLTALGFEEFDGPLVETDFWNSDALFMPQFHAARDIHDVYYLKHPTHAKTIEEPFLSRVADIHETGGQSGSRGWHYHFDRDFTRQLLLRSQSTVLSAHQLAKAKIPGKYFGIARCFRYDKVDATHLSDFYQTEGIVLGEQVNLRTLLGILKMFAVEIAGATEVKYVGGYFPFTEPSIEVHIKHPVLGWFELGGSGIFRPEVTAAMGVHVPVLAWGIGIDRMALMALGLNDLRDLFSADIEGVRLRR